MISPLDYRYYDEELALNCLSGRAEIRYQSLVEQAAVRELRQLGMCNDDELAEIEGAVLKLSAEDVEVEENRIQHNIRALVNTIQKALSNSAKPKVHFGLTSFDILDCANAMRIRDALQLFVLPSLISLEESLIELARREAGTFQIGRTHGQHAVPITFGFAVAEYVSRLGGRIELLMLASERAPGKISGAVGAYNATGLVYDDPVAFEAEVLGSLGLRQLDHSTQIVQPEWMADTMHLIATTFGIIANLADDMRNLQRTEIGEVGEAFSAEQVGSSTMPHKRNPWNWENIKSMWKEFMPRMITIYMDQISEHQRDLTNSASARFNTEPVAALNTVAKRANRVAMKLVADRERMDANLRMNGDLSMSEPLQVILSALGYPEAHEHVRKMTLEAQKMSPPDLLSLFWSDASLEEFRARMTDHQVHVLQNLRNYTGLSEKRTYEVCNNWQPLMFKIKEELSRIAQMSKSA
jgi:adenylosuccinate lyase